MYRCFGKTMGSWVVFFVVLSSMQSGQATIQIDSDLTNNPCKPDGDSDIADSDALPNSMFKAYKKEAESESPPAAHATTLSEVNAHEMFARFFRYIDKYLRGEIPSDDPAASELRVPTSHTYSLGSKWPYRCLDHDAAFALHVFLSGPLDRVFTHATDIGKELALMEFSLVLRLPQFTPYVKDIQISVLHPLCPMILSTQLDDIRDNNMLGNFELAMRRLLAPAITACRPPYESEFFCFYRKLQTVLSNMWEDYRRERKPEMENFSLFWFLTPIMLDLCEDSFISEVKEKVLVPFGKLAVVRLEEITKLGSTTGDDLRKIRAFMYDFIFTTFIGYQLDNDVIKPSTPQSPFTPESGHSPNSFYAMRQTSGPGPSSKQDVLQCFRYFALHLIDIENALVNEADITEIKALSQTALFWFLHPDFQLDDNDEYVDSILDGIEYHVGNTRSLIRLGKAARKYKNTICTRTNRQRLVKYCTLHDLLFDIQIFATTFDEKPSMKILKPSLDYKKILELSTRGTTQSEIAQLRVNQEELQQTIFNLRSSLGEHFRQLATFDQDKAQYDAEFLKGKIKDFDERIDGTKITDKLYVILYHAIGSNVAELAQLVTQLAFAMAKNANPIGWLTGAASLQEILDQVNAIAKAAVNSAKLVVISENLFPRLAEEGSKIQNAIASNSLVHTKLKTTFDQLKDQESVDIDAVHTNFLADYAAYDPGWSKGDLSSYTNLLKEIIEELCNILYAGGTAASAVVQAVGAAKSGCLTTKVDAEVLEAIYSEMYDFQFDFMEAMAQAIRALVTKHSANNVKNIPEDDGNSALYSLHLKSYTHRVKIQSKQHVLAALKEACDVDEYKNGGVPTDECEATLKSSLSAADVDRVIGRRVTECPADQTGDFHVRFPAKLNPDGAILQPGVLDLTKLFNGVPTPFQIPYSRVNPWTARFASSFIPTNPEVGLYVKRMEIYLPDLTNNVPHEVKVTIKQDGLSKIAAEGRVKYGFSTPKTFTLAYAENTVSCANPKSISPYPKLCDPGPSKICITSKGVVSENEIAPPLHNKWLIKFIIPGNLPKPKPPSFDGSFYMRGVLQVCHKNPKNIDLDDDRPPDIDLEGSSSNECCPDGEFLYINDNVQICQKCPDGFSTKSGGLYCHKDPEGGKHQKKRFFHHRSRREKIKKIKIQHK